MLPDIRRFFCFTSRKHFHGSFASTSFSWRLFFWSLLRKLSNDTSNVSDWLVIFPEILSANHKRSTRPYPTLLYLCNISVIYYEIEKDRNYLYSFLSHAHFPYPILFCFGLYTISHELIKLLIIRLCIISSNRKNSIIVFIFAYNQKNGRELEKKFLIKNITYFLINNKKESLIING